MTLHQKKTHPEFVEGCFGCKAATITFGTVPGGAKDKRTGISRGRKMEKNLVRYERRKKAGDNPSGIGDQAYRKDRRIEQIKETRPDIVEQMAEQGHPLE